MDPSDCFDPSNFDAEFNMPSDIPVAVVELEVPTSSRTLDNASPPLLVGEFSHSLNSTTASSSRTFKTPPPPPPAPSPSPSSCSSSGKRRRTYMPDPIRGTSQHLEKRQRNNAAVRKSRAKASEEVQLQEQQNAERRRQTELYRTARSELEVMVHRFKENIFDRSASAQADQRALCEGLKKINQKLKDQGLDVPSLDET